MHNLSPYSDHTHSDTNPLALYSYIHNIHPLYYSHIISLGLYITSYSSTNTTNITSTILLQDILYLLNTSKCLNTKLYSITEVNTFKQFDLIT